MPETAIIRSIGGRLGWYPPGAGDEPTWLDSDEAREQLMATLNEHRGSACFAAPGEAVRLLALEISGDEKRHFQRSLPYMLEEQLAEDLELLHFSAMNLEGLRYVVAVCASEQMRDWQAHLTGLGDVKRWVPEPLLLPWRDAHWCIVVEDTHAVVRCAQAEGFSVELELLEPLLQARLAEAEEPPGVLVHGQDQELDLARLPESLRSVAHWRRGGFASAQQVAEAEEASLNLLQGEFAPQLPLGRWWQQWRAVAAVFAIAFTVQMLATWLDYRQLNAENIALRTAVQDSYREVNPRGAVVDAEKQLRRQLEALRGSGQSSGFVSLMDRVGGVIAKSRGTSITSINYSDRGGEMRLNIVARNFEAVEAIREGIAKAGLRAEMESSSARDDGVRARIRVGEA
ncbi:MAG: type II secretion system protein GspL [Pseudomonadota bacterium]